MSDMKTVDARGLSCPEPAMRAKQAMREAGSGRIEVLIDNGTSRDNVERIARVGGWSVETSQLEGDDIRLLLEKS